MQDPWEDQHLPLLQGVLCNGSQSKFLQPVYVFLDPFSIDAHMQTLSAGNLTFNAVSTIVATPG